MFKKLFSLVTIMALILSMTACGNKAEKALDEIAVQKTGLYENPINFTIEMENGGIMKGELYPNLAPKTVENFVKLVDSKFYDGLIFHRVIDGFMIQGGGFDKDMMPKEAESITGEFTANGFNNELKHTKGVLSMARTNDPNSASSQFFIMHQTAQHLDGQYAGFGRITSGFEIINEIAKAETTVYQAYGMSDVPVEPQIIKTITIDK